MNQQQPTIDNSRPVLPGQIFVTHGDLTQISCDAIVFSTSTALQFYGAMCQAFEDAFQFKARFAQTYPSPRNLQVGQSFWLSLETKVKPYGMVVTVATGDYAVAHPHEHPAALAVRGAIRCAVSALRERKAHASLPTKHKGAKLDRLQIALPLFRFGTGDQGDDQLLSATMQIGAGRQVLDELQQTDLWGTGIDIVFVAYTYDHYQMFLHARRQANVRPQVAVEIAPELVHAIRNGECVLFVGAGLSRTAGMKSYEDLIQQMAREVGEPATKIGYEDYLDIAQWFREKCARENRPGTLAALIAKHYGAGRGAYRPALNHYHLMSMPLRMIVTTNYDTLLETTLKALRKASIKVVNDREIVQTGSREGTYVVKMHGDAEACVTQSETDHDGIVISRDDYDHFFINKPVMATLLKGLLLNQTFLFVGYSLRDPNFRQIHSEIAHLLQEAKRRAFAVTFGSISAPRRAQWAAKQVKLLAIPGEDDTERNLNFACLLDRLAEEVAGTTHLLLARDLSSYDDRTPLSELIQELQSVGRGIERDIARNLTPQTAPALARTLRFLTEQGWRPEDSGPSRLARLWKRLALSAPTDNERRDWLVRALMHAEDAHTIKELHDLQIQKEREANA